MSRRPHSGSLPISNESRSSGTTAIFVRILTSCAPFHGSAVPSGAATHAGGPSVSVVDSNESVSVAVWVPLERGSVMFQQHSAEPSSDRTMSRTLPTARLSTVSDESTSSTSAERILDRRAPCSRADEWDAEFDTAGRRTHQWRRWVSLGTRTEDGLPGVYGTATGTTSAMLMQIARAQ